MAQVSYFPHYYLGRGLNTSTGDGFGVAIDFEEPIESNHGQTVLFQLKQISDSNELLQKLDLSTSLSFTKGFGGLSAAYNLSRSKEVNHYNTFALVSVVVTNAPKLIRNPVYKKEALEILEKEGWEKFSQKFGWEYIEGRIDGGTYYGLIQIKTASEKDREDVSVKLSGFYGAFKGDARFSQVMQEIQKRFELEVLVASSAGSGEVVKTSLEEMIDRAVNFPSVVLQDPVPVAALTAEYSKTILGGDSPDLAMKYDQKNCLEYLGKNYLELKDYKTNLDIVVKNMEDFDDFREMSPEQIIDEKKKLRDIMLSIDKEMDKIAALAEKCSEDPKRCKHYSPSLAMLTLPKIRGDQMTMQEMESQIKSLLSEVSQIKSDTGQQVFRNFLAGNISVAGDISGKLKFSQTYNLVIQPNGQVHSLRMRHSNDCFAFITGFSGSFQGAGEHVWIDIDNEGFWTLYGTSLQVHIEVQARCAGRV